MEILRLKTAVLKRIMAVSNKIEKHRLQIKEAISLIAKQKILKEELIEMHDLLVNLLKLTELVNKWSEEVGDRVAREG